MVIPEEKKIQRKDTKVRLSPEVYAEIVAYAELQHTSAKTLVELLWLQHKRLGDIDERAISEIVPEATEQECKLLAGVLQIIRSSDPGHQILTKYLEDSVELL